MEYIQKATDAVNAFVDSIKAKPKKEYDRVVGSVSDAFDSSVKTVSSGAQGTLNTMHEKGVEQAEIVREYAGVLASHEDKFFSSLKGVVKEAIVSNPAPSAAATAAALLLLLPGPRGMLYRRTLGRLRSEEGTYRTVAAQMETVTTTIKQQKQDMEKLEGEVAKALQEYNDKKNNLRNARGKMASLASAAQNSHAQCKSMLTTLRDLSGKDAIRLRSEVAVTANTAKYQRSAIEKAVSKVPNV